MCGHFPPYTESKCFLTADASWLPSNSIQFWAFQPGGVFRSQGWGFSPARLPHFRCQLQARVLHLCFQLTDYKSSFSPLPPWFNLLEQCSEPRKTLTYIYQFIIKNIPKDTYKEMHRANVGRGMKLPCPVGGSTPIFSYLESSQTQPFGGFMEI